MLAYRVIRNEIAERRLYWRALAALKDLRHEMDLVGRYVIVDARQRLRERNSQVSIGRLAKSLRHRAYRRAVTISSVLPYALVQQAGATIKPSKRKWLAIPLRLEDKRVHLWPKHIKPTKNKRLVFIRVNARKALLLFVRTGAKGKVIEKYVRFVLLKKVKIKGRPYVVKSRELVEHMRGLIIRRYREEFGKAG